MVRFIALIHQTKGGVWSNQVICASSTVSREWKAACPLLKELL